MYDSTQGTLDHIAKVRGYLDWFAAELGRRGEVHDASKLESPEKEAFDAATPLLSASTYGSEEYRAGLALPGPALAHHYAKNSHHAEHFPDGINGMSLLDVVEMWCDWLAASQRHKNGDFVESIAINRKRFQMDPQLADIFMNTYIEMGGRNGAAAKE